MVNSEFVKIPCNFHILTFNPSEKQNSRGGKQSCATVYSTVLIYTQVPPKQQWRHLALVSIRIFNLLYTQLERFWRDSLYVTDDAIAKPLCDAKFCQIGGKGRIFRHIELKTGEGGGVNLLVRCHVFSITLALDMADTGVHSPLDIDMTMCTKKEVRIFTNNYSCCSFQKNVSL